MIRGCNAELEVQYLCVIVSDPSLKFVGGQVLMTRGPKATLLVETCQGLHRVAKITRRRAAKTNLGVDTVIGRRRGGCGFLGRRRRMIIHKVPADLLAALREIPRTADLPHAPAGLAVTADGTIVELADPDLPPGPLGASPRWGTGPSVLGRWIGR